MMDKQANPNHPVHALIAQRWSPYGFAERSVSESDLCSLFEAARWAASSYNEQPWSFIVARKENQVEFKRLLSCLVDANQAWAKAAAVLALGLANLNFRRNNEPNRCALHDLGLSAGSLSLEATARGLLVHQMAGILPERARELYRIPDGTEAVTGIAVGYAADPARPPPPLGDRDRAPRQRKLLSDFVFSGVWGNPAEVVSAATPDSPE